MTLWLSLRYQYFGFKIWLSLGYWYLVSTICLTGFCVVGDGDKELRNDRNDRNDHNDLFTRLNHLLGKDALESKYCLIYIGGFHLL